MFEQQVGTCVRLNRLIDERCRQGGYAGAVEPGIATVLATGAGTPMGRWPGMQVRSRLLRRTAKD